MHSLRRSAPRALRQSQSTTVRPATRRFAHEEHGSSSHSVPHDPAPATEGFGKSFYICLTAIPVSYLVYALSSDAVKADGTPANPLTRLIAVYSDYKETWSERNALHTRAVEQAAFDRNLFHNTPSPNYIDLRFPEIFSTGSAQVNVHAGGGKANLEHLITRYREQAFAEEEEKRRLQQEGKLGPQAKQSQEEDKES